MPVKGRHAWKARKTPPARKGRGSAASKTAQIRETFLSMLYAWGAFSVALCPTAMAISKA